MREEVEWASSLSEYDSGKTSSERLSVLASKLRVRTVELGLNFEVSPSEAVDAGSVRAWAGWAAAHLVW